MYTRPVPLARRRRRSAAGSPDRSGFAVTSQRFDGRSSSGRRSTAGGQRGPRAVAVAVVVPRGATRARGPRVRRPPPHRHRGSLPACQLARESPVHARPGAANGTSAAASAVRHRLRRDHRIAAAARTHDSAKHGVGRQPFTRRHEIGCDSADDSIAAGAPGRRCDSLRRGRRAVRLTRSPGTSRRAACDWPCSEPAPIVRECRYCDLSTRRQSRAAIRRDSDEATRASSQLSSSLQVSSRNRTIRTEMTTWHSKWEQANDQNEDSSV
jgi:hypothetical protein